MQNGLDLQHRRALNKALGDFRIERAILAEEG